MGSDRPVVGITPSFDYDEGANDPARVTGVHRLSENYVRWVRLAGGLPILLPSVFDSEMRAGYLSLVDALLFSGGGDVDPSVFGEEPIPDLGKVDPLRDEFELALCEEALTLGTPILGICRGAQVLNIAAGGRVLQDISSSVPKPLQHMQRAPRWHASHRIDLAADSLLGQLAGTTEIRVNSFHHQAVGEVAPGFRAVAHTPDGVVEAIESSQGLFAVGVQWHPEGMGDEDSFSAALFGALMEAGRKFAARR